MATIGTLAVNVVANTNPLAKGLGGQATKAVKDFQSSAMSATSSVAGMVTQIAAVAGIAVTAGAAIMGLKSAFDSIDSTAKLADRIGATTEELQRLRYAGDLAGEGAESVDNGLSKMTRKIGEAKQGSAEAAQAFWNLGLPVEKLAAMSPADAFAEIAQRISELPTPAERAAAAVDVFGRSGQELLNVLMLGKKGLAEMGAEADKLGVSFSRVDAAKVEEAHDAVERVGAALKGLWNTAIIALAPVIELLANGLTWAVQMTVEGFKILRDLVTELVGGIAAFVGAIIDGVKWLLGFDSANADAAKSIEQNTAAMDANREALQAAADAEKMAIETKKEHDELMKRGAQLAQQFRTPWEIYADTINDLNKLLDVGAIKWQTYQRAVGKATKDLEDATKASDKFQTGGNQGVAAVSMGTAEAFSAIAESQQNMQQMVDLQREEAKHLEDINEGIQQLVRQGAAEPIVVHQASIL